MNEDEPLPGWSRFYITDPRNNRIELLEPDKQSTERVTWLLSPSLPRILAIAPSTITDASENIV